MAAPYAPGRSLGDVLTGGLLPGPAPVSKQDVGEDASCGDHERSQEGAPEAIHLEGQAEQGRQLGPQEFTRGFPSLLVV